MRSKKRSKNSGDFYLLVLSSIKQGMNPAQICEANNITKQALNYYLKQLKRQSLIAKVGYSQWNVKEVKILPPPTETPSFPLETPKPSEEVYQNTVKDEVKRLVEPIFNRVLQETPPNPVWVGQEPSKPIVTFYWQPHEYRLYFSFSKYNYTSKKVSNPAIEDMQSRVSTFQDYDYEPKNHNSEHHYKNFMGCTIIVRKNTIEIINNWHRKQWREITGSIKDIDERIDSVISELDQQCLDALKVFVTLHGGMTDYKVLKKRCYNGIQGDDYVDKIPEDMIIKDGVFQKLYKKKIELYTPTQVKTFFKNRVIEDIAPEIATQIGQIGTRLNTFEERQEIILKNQQSFTEDALFPLTEQIKLHLEVQRSTLKTQQETGDTMEGIKNTLKQIGDVIAMKDKEDRLKSIKVAYQQQFKHDFW